ncbi:PEP-CTERM sorting domain-containing protein [uncultured Paraglaciecola sp.]|uniref:PEP-CTERM sorting domain-containing protein n=1 Tax=uncultured Paraglaciecola sp. TaxID=1765024 RepID=UPI002593E2B7|nr:PEP-CTERM sorting domain-containing protein [uncultured Paraglaciecola sp.]
MKKQSIASTILGALALFVTSTSSAVPITDVQEYINNTATEYFVVDDDAKYNSPYYRWSYEDWGWVHDGIAGSGFSSIVLEISAFDVDYSSGELDMIDVFDGASWVSLGYLAGSSDIWDFTTFDLTGYSWAEAQVNAGLQVRMDIDTLEEGWLVTLGRATLSVDGGDLVCVPTPGVPCETVDVPEPTSVVLLSLGLAGLGLSRRRRVRN